ncbi:MAG: hypothetical protein COA79_17810 [Planctomycetota bacterium]|nr:MAG: hypothetical protein COA79_17810 [Planctomycetota bacterium]
MDTEIKLKPVSKSKTLKESAYDEIKKIIIAGKINPDKYYSANQFATMLGISRTPVREAVMQLASEGFLVLHNGIGFKIKVSSSKEIKDFFETRKILEIYLIQNFAEKMEKKDLDYLEIELDIMKKYSITDDAEGFIESDKNFHAYFMKKSSNDYLINIMEGLQELITIMGIKTIQQLKRKESVIEEHQNIVDALKKNDVNAAIKAMSDHLDQTEELLLSNESL